VTTYQPKEQIHISTPIATQELMRRKKAELEEKGFIFDLYHYLWCDED